MSEAVPPQLDPWLLQMLRCPAPHHAPVVPDPETGELVCQECGAAFPVRDGIPVMLWDEARRDPSA